MTTSIYSLSSILLFILLVGCQQETKKDKIKEAITQELNLNGNTKLVEVLPASVLIKPNHYYGLTVFEGEKEHLNMKKIKKYIDGGYVNYDTLNNSLVLTDKALENIEYNDSSYVEIEGDEYKYLEKILYEKEGDVKCSVDGKNRQLEIINASIFFTKLEKEKTLIQELFIDNFFSYDTIVRKVTFFYDQENEDIITCIDNEIDYFKEESSLDFPSSRFRYKDNLTLNVNADRFLNEEFISVIEKAYERTPGYISLSTVYHLGRDHHINTKDFEKVKTLEEKGFLYDKSPEEKDVYRVGFYDSTKQYIIGEDLKRSIVQIKTHEYAFYEVAESSILGVFINASPYDLTFNIMPKVKRVNQNHLYNILLNEKDNIYETLGGNWFYYNSKKDSLWN